MEILERAQALEREGIDVVHLEVGEPDFPLPACVAEAAEEALRQGQTHYTHSLGIPELRAEISAHYRSQYGVEIDPGRVIITTGTSAGLLLLMALLLDAGDEVLIPDPGYACYANFVRAFHGKPKPFPVAAEDAFQYDSSVVEKHLTDRTRALIVNSPANPTAAVQSREVLEALARIPVPVISDEIYHGLTYSGKAHSMLEFDPDAFVLDGFSKRFAMTGLRIGWLVAPEPTVATLQKLQQNLFICASSVAQYCGLAALKSAGSDVEAMRLEYAQRRDLLLAGLERLGFEVPCTPQGAYYVLARADHLDTDSLRLAHNLLEEAHVGVTPGADFGTRAEGHLRFSFASAAERIEEGLDRLEKWLQARKE